MKYITILFFLFISVNAHSSEGGFFEFGKVPGAGNDHWSLSDWMGQKSHFKVMDHWLVMNTDKEWFFVVLGGGVGSYDAKTITEDKEYDFSHYSISIWASLFGFEYFYEDRDEDTTVGTGLFNLRLFGTTPAGGNLNIFGGVRKWELDAATPNELSSTVAGGRLQFYLISVLGASGEYWKIFKADDDLDRSVEGSRSSYGIFLQIGQMRLFGNYFDEDLDIDNAGTAEDESRSGYEVGLKLYF